MARSSPGQAMAGPLCCAEPWAPQVAALPTANTSAWHALVEPLASMVRLTYTATYGSYFKPEDQNASIPKWQRPAGLTLNPPAGVRALFFWQAATMRGVVAFRGTDWGEGDSGDADRCADAHVGSVAVSRYTLAVALAALAARSTRAPKCSVP